MALLAVLLAALLAAALVAGTLPAAMAGASPPELPAVSREDGRVVYRMELTASWGSPDCVERPIILVNGMFQPTLRVRVNNTLQLTVINRLPYDFPQTSAGVSIHFHGFSMRGQAAWFDGAAYVTQCPIDKTRSFTYTFKVDEAPGIYFWHDHSTGNRANGLQGAFIVEPPLKVPLPFGKIDGEHVLFMTDWFREEGNVMQMRLNRPFDADKVTNTSGGTFQWVGSGDSVLVNGMAVRDDCPGAATPPILGANGYVVRTCSVQAPTQAPSDKARSSGQGCNHEEIRVRAGERHMIHLVNAGTLLFLTVCFEGHDVMIVNADTTPTEWVRTRCVDINVAQRYSLILEANQAPNRAYWISVLPQYRSNAPAAYAFLRYTGGGAPRLCLPLTPTPQPGVLPWSEDMLSSVVTASGVLGTLENNDFEKYWKLFTHRGLNGDGMLSADADRIVVVNTTQPVMQENGMIRWALNNVATPQDPPCEPLMRLVQRNASWLSARTLDGSNETAVKEANAKLLDGSDLANTNQAGVYVNGQSAPVVPGVGVHIVEIQHGEVVDVVLQNRPANEAGGDYKPGVNRTAMEQHPMHMHGHKFWVLGWGNGIYDPVESLLNSRTQPLLRDTVTMKEGQWVYLRFVARNPGLWPMHCHIMWHEFMGQLLHFVESRDRWVPQPRGFPNCPTKCYSNMGPFSTTFVNATFTDKKGVFRWGKP